MAGRGSQDDLGWYMGAIESTTRLTAQEECDLARRCQEDSDPHARDEMIRANLRLVVSVAQQFAGRGMPLADLVAEGNLGLMRAVEEFDADAGTRFSTYATWWIKQTIRTKVINARQPIRIPEYLAKLAGKWRRAAGGLEATLGRPPTADEIAEKLHISKKRAASVQHGLRAVNAPSQTGEGANALSEMLADDEPDQPDEQMWPAFDGPMLRKLLDTLEPRERKILELRFGLDGYDGPPRTAKEIGQYVGLGRKRVIQLEKKALADLKKAAADLV